MAYNEKVDYTKEYAPKTGRQQTINPRVQQINSEASGASNEPVFKSVVKGGIQATVWENQVQNDKGESYPRLSVTLQKSYKDKDGNYQKTGSLSANDVPRALFVLQQAYEWMITYKDQPED